MLNTTLRIVVGLSMTTVKEVSPMAVATCRQQSRKCLILLVSDPC
jgi:hypothetical protein